ncbi:HEPN domain-containing protein [Candidatus Woesearchaeota archaeon]|nr:HEPN domain-containing protein [Candidatus Woesearchaeota archaeon]
MRKEVENWWEQAKDDLDSAIQNLTIKKYHLVVFLCQQSVEKGLKAVYIHQKELSPGTTNSLIFLASEIKLPSEHFKFLRELTPQFVNTRYPDAAYGLPKDLYDEEIAQEYLKKTKEVFKWLKLQIEK